MFLLDAAPPSVGEIILESAHVWLPRLLLTVMIVAAAVCVLLTIRKRRRGKNNMQNPENGEGREEE